MSDSASTVRLAMWSGPRNISTAMMRSWGNRPDTYVCDEPFYAHYLHETGAPHPMAEEIIAHYPTDASEVIDWLTGDVPGGKRIFYQKQMTHHLLPGIERGWLAEVTNCFLIRDPGEVITSYLRKNYEPNAQDLGFVQQVEIYDYVRGQGLEAPVIDARDVLEDPARVLGMLCERLGIEFSRAMLKWPPGLRETDGIWASHWYPEVETSTGFRPYRAKEVAVPAQLERLHAESREIYERLYALRLG